MNKHLTNTAARAFLACLVMSCASREPLPASPAPRVPTWEEFRSSVLIDDRGAFIVDGDIALWSEPELRAYYDAGVRDALEDKGDIALRQSPLLVDTIGGVDNAWAFPGALSMTFCVNPNFTPTQQAALLPALDAATRSWADRVAVEFTRVETVNCSSSDTSVVFNVRSISFSGFFAVAFFPDDQRSQRELLVDDSAFTTTAGGRDLQGILTHELGHTVGFRHEHARLTPTCTGETDADTRALTDYDVDSVMHYPQCRPSGTGGYRQTEKDYEGAISLYGVAPALVVNL